MYGAVLDPRFVYRVGGRTQDSHTQGSHRPRRDSSQGKTYMFAQWAVPHFDSDQMVSFYQIVD